MFNCGAAVGAVIPSESFREGTFVAVGSGVFGVYCNAPPRALLIQGEAVAFEYSHSQELLTFHLDPGPTENDNGNDNDNDKAVVRIQW